MSGQYPGGYNSPHGGHRGQFNPQQQQQMMNQMGQGAMDGGGGGNAQGGGGGAMMPMGGYAGGGGMPQQQQQQQPSMGMGMQSPSQQQQMMSMQQQQQMQMQHQQQQMAGAGGGAGGMQQHMGGMMPQGGMHMQQQQQHMNPNMQQPQMQGGVPNQGAPMAQQHHQHGAANGPPQQQHLPPPPPPQQQPPHPQHPQTSSTGMLPTTMTPHPMPHKEINIVQLSRLGQETVQDITSRFQEVFSALKIIQPSQNRDNNTEKKVQENFRTIRLLFKRVRIIYEKCNDGYPQGMEFAHVESLIPLKDDGDHRNEGVNCEEYRKVMQENQELIETVKLKNRQLREIIDRTRIIIWEINTMLAMRRS